MLVSQLSQNKIFFSITGMVKTSILLIKPYKLISFKSDIPSDKIVYTSIHDPLLFQYVNTTKHESKTANKYLRIRLSSLGLINLPFTELVILVGLFNVVTT